MSVFTMCSNDMDACMIKQGNTRTLGVYNIRTLVSNCSFEADVINEGENYGTNYVYTVVLEVKRYSYSSLTLCAIWHIEIAELYVVISNNIPGKVCTISPRKIISSSSSARFVGSRVILSNKQ